MCANAQTGLINTDKVVLLFEDGSRSEGTGGQVSEKDASLGHFWLLLEFL